jgi:hypothetical protein
MLVDMMIQKHDNNFNKLGFSLNSEMKIPGWKKSLVFTEELAQDLSSTRKSRRLIRPIWIKSTHYPGKEAKR